MITVKSGLWEVRLQIREEWRSALIQTGVQFVDMAGIMTMLQWFAINLVTDEMVNLSFITVHNDFSIIILYILYRCTYNLDFKSE